MSNNSLQVQMSPVVDENVLPSNQHDHDLIVRLQTHQFFGGNADSREKGIRLSRNKEVNKAMVRTHGMYNKNVGRTLEFKKRNDHGR